MFRQLRFAPLLAALLMVCNVAMAAKEVPVEDFFKRSGYSSFQLSPDGKYLAAITPVNNRRNIAVITVSYTHLTLPTMQ